MSNYLLESANNKVNIYLHEAYEQMSKLLHLYSQLSQL